MRSVPAIAFDYRPSRWLLVAVVVAAVLAFVAIALSGLDVRIKLPIAMAGAVYAFWALRAFVRVPFDRVTWHPAGHWRLRDANAECADERTGELVGATSVGTAIVLSLRVGAKHTVALALLPDNCDRDTRRILRVRLSRIAARG